MDEPSGDPYRRGGICWRRPLTRLERTRESCRLLVAVFNEVGGASACNPAETVPCRTRASPHMLDQYSAYMLTAASVYCAVGGRFGALVANFA